MGLLYREDLSPGRRHRGAEDLGRLRRGGRDLPLQEPEELPGQRGAQPARSDRGLPVAGRCPPVRFDGKQTVKVDLASDEAKKVVKFWGDLVTSGGASNDADFNDSWYQGLTNGKWATLPIAAWGPVFLAGSGRARRPGSGGPPTFRSGMPSKVVSSNWGGSTDAVLKLSKNQIAASQLALFINTDKESALQFANKQFLFPAMNEILTDPASSTRSPSSTAARR